MTDTPNPPSSMPPVDPLPPGGNIPDPADVEKNKVFAILAYLWLLVLVPIFAARQSPFARYHANQGLLLLGIWACAAVVFIAALIFAFIPFLGWILACGLYILATALCIGIFVYAIMGIVNAVNGKMKPLPGLPVITIIK